MDPMWEWFCGENSSFLTGSPDSFDKGINNTCFINGLTVLPHAAFATLASIILFAVGVCSGYRGYNTRYVIRFPGHLFRWIITMLFMIVLIAAIGEGILSDTTYRDLDLGTQPYLYMGSIAALLGTMLSLVFYHHMEVWDLSGMDFLLLTYWVMGCLAESLRVINLYELGLAEFTVVRFSISCISILIYLLLIVIDLNVIRVKVLHLCQSSTESFPNDLLNPEMEYMYYYVNFLSQQSYYWISWLMTLGYKRPLEMEDLGALPARHETKYNHTKFKRVLKQELDKCARHPGTRPSLWTVYLKVYGLKLVSAGCLKVAADFCELVGPLVIGGLTAYVSTLSYPVDIEPVPPHHVTFSEFFGNGFVLVGTLFFAFCIKTVLIQGHFHLAILQSMNVRAALQAVVFEKSLRMSTFATTGGMMTIGQITNHMSTDSMNVLGMFQTINYMWSIPIQLVFSLILLYVQMGISALIGASLFLLVFLIQFKIA